MEADILPVLWRAKHGPDGWGYEQLTSGEAAQFRSEVRWLLEPNLLAAIARDAGVFEWWGSDCRECCDGNATHNSAQCDTCGSVDTVPLYEMNLRR